VSGSGELPFKLPLTKVNRYEIVTGHACSIADGNGNIIADRVWDEGEADAIVAAVNAHYGDRRALLSHLAAVTRERDEARADAGRYRWLRYGDNDELVLRVFGEDDSTPSRPFDPAKDYCYLPRDKRLDTAIDAQLSPKEQRND
jgi:hypothetical protein